MGIQEARATKHPRSIAIVNYKGGVGKTTITYLLGSVPNRQNMILSAALGRGGDHATWVVLAER